MPKCFKDSDLSATGLIPWRFRDLYFLMKYRLKKDQSALRRLAGIHRGWFRLPHSSEIPVHIGPDNVDAEYSSLASNSVPEPLQSMHDAPLTGVRAPPTPLWKMDFVVSGLANSVNRMSANHSQGMDVCLEYVPAGSIVWHHVGPQQIQPSCLDDRLPGCSCLHPRCSWWYYGFR